jgi:hypothetical protein
MGRPADNCTELGGADWFLITVERMMRANGQGKHVGMTVLRVGEGFDLEGFRSAVMRIAAASPIANGQLVTSLFSVPKWQWTRETRVEFPVTIHPALGDWVERAQEILDSPDEAPVRFDVFPRADGHWILFRWLHVLLDGKGAELLLAEIARLSGDRTLPAKAESWGIQPPKIKGWRAVLGEAERFKEHFYALSKKAIRSLGGSNPDAGAARFLVEEFTVEETAEIARRAAEVSRGMFQIGWFLAATMRAHLRVLESRGETAETFQAGCAVQERKRGARHPIWQNQVSQLFFCLRPGELGDLAAAAALLQSQFTEMSRNRLEVAFGVMARLFRHLPAWFYLRMLKSNSGGHLTSFFFSHTGEFLPECAEFCGAPVEQGWHIPTVSQPPGTGIFFGQRSGKMTATFAWREKVLRDGELAILRASIRRDLLGP